MTLELIRYFMLVLVDLIYLPSVVCCLQYLAQTPLIIKLHAFNDLGLHHVAHQLQIPLDPPTLSNDSFSLNLSL